MFSSYYIVLTIIQISRFRTMVYRSQQDVLNRCTGGWILPFILSLTNQKCRRQNCSASKSSHIVASPLSSAPSSRPSLPSNEDSDDTAPDSQPEFPEITSRGSPTLCTSTDSSTINTRSSTLLSLGTSTVSPTDSQPLTTQPSTPPLFDMVSVVSEVLQQFHIDTESQQSILEHLGNHAGSEDWMALLRDRASIRQEILTTIIDAVSVDYTADNNTS